MISEDTFDKIHNALLIGMSLDDAYIYAGLTPQEIDVLNKDEEFQVLAHQHQKELEYTLLNRMHQISEKQVRMGKEAGTAWLLEHLFERYNSKPKNELPEIHIHTQDTDPLKEDTVTVFKEVSPQQ